MATVRWRGDAQGVFQVTTITVAGTWAGAETVTLTINGKDLELTVGTDTTTAQIATALKEMFNGDTQTGTGDHTFSETGDDVPEFDAITATVSGSVVTLTADDAGVPFTLTASETSTSGTLTVATPTAATGPNHWNNAENWDTGAVPVSTDDVYFENSDVDVLYGLDQNAVTLTSLNIAASYTGKIGLPDWNAGGWWEYLDKYLKISATTLKVGYGLGGGSPRLKINVGTAACTATVEGTGSPAEQTLPALLLVGTNVGNVLNVSKGSVGVAWEAGQTSTVATIRASYQASPATDVTLRLGSGCTLTTVNLTGGDVEVNSAFTTLNMTGGSLTIKGSGAITTLNVDGGTVHDQGTGTKTTVNLGKATIDRSQTMLGNTWTNTNLYAGATLEDPFETITFTNPFALKRCGLKDVTLDLGTDFSLQRS